MKKMKTKLIAYGLAALTACSFAVAAMQTKTLTAYAATGEEFLSDVALVYEDSAEDAQEAIAGTDWKLFNKDLNPNNDITVFDDGVYLIYKTSTNVEDAITDLRVMDMYGGYQTTNYQRQLEKTKQAYKEKVKELRVAADEFKTRLFAGDAMAELAYRQMSYYRDMRTKGGTETGRLMGDFFLFMPADDDKVIQVMMEGNAFIVSNLISLLAIGISGAGEETFATRVAEMYEIKDTFSHEEYHDISKVIATSLEAIKAKLIRYDSLKEEYNLEDEEMTEEEYAFLTEYATLADLLTLIKLGETTLADFIKGTWTTEDLYPIAAALTPGQKALVNMGQLETILKYNSPSKPIEELIEAVEEVEEGIKDENGYLKVFDVYAGVDREIFKGEFAMTTEADRQQALTGKTWDASDASAVKGGQLVGHILVGTLDLALAGAAIGITVKKTVLSVSLFFARRAATRATVAAYTKLETAHLIAANKLNAFNLTWGALQVPLLVMTAAVTLIMAGGYGIATWWNYYHPEYLEIPNTLIDVKETDLGDKYIKYSVAKVLDPDDGEENADFNAYEGKEWIALYYTKDATAGNCLTPNFVYRENNSTVAKRHQGVSMFGESNAFNLNSHVYNSSAKGIYLSVRYSTTKKAAADIPSVVGSMIGGAYYVLTAIGGAGLGVGGMALFQHLKSKKKEEVVEETLPEETTTTGE